MTLKHHKVEEGMYKLVKGDGTPLNNKYEEITYRNKR